MQDWHCGKGLILLAEILAHNKSALCRSAFLHPDYRIEVKITFMLIAYLVLLCEFFWEFSIFQFCRPLVDIYWHPLLKTYWSDIYRTFIEFQCIFKIGEISSVISPPRLIWITWFKHKKKVFLSKACGNNHLVDLPGELININHYNWVVRQTTT